MPKNYYNENDPKAAQWLRNLIAAGLIPDGHVDDRSICDVQPADLAGYTQCHFFAGIGGWPYALELAGWPVDWPVWTGSCPCQPFSTAGKRKGEADERHLWPEMYRLIRECRPATCFGEQVASNDGCAWMASVFTDMEQMEYRVAGAGLCSAGIGSPSHRNRLYWVADAYKDLEPRRAIHAKTRRTQTLDEVASRHWLQPPRATCRRVDHGISRGVDSTCAGFGNAIVPQVAAEFIGAFMDIQ
jgi:DNA (cytosine-5)-methyltransferase 1